MRKLFSCLAVILFLPTGSFANELLGVARIPKLATTINPNKAVKPVPVSVYASPDLKSSSRTIANRKVIPMKIFGNEFVVSVFAQEKEFLKIKVDGTDWWIQTKDVSGFEPLEQMLAGKTLELGAWDGKIFDSPEGRPIPVRTVKRSVEEGPECVVELEAFKRISSKPWVQIKIVGENCIYVPRQFSTSAWIRLFDNEGEIRLWPTGPR